jgi:hypothetical protein
MNVKQRKRHQGYLHSAARPMCCNCRHSSEDLAKGAYATHSRCGLGDFPAALGGWCPKWSPSDGWKNLYPDAAAALTASSKEV